MKKLLILLFSFLVFITISTPAFSRPIYIGVRFGFFAKWQIVIGQCEDGNGICLSFPLPNNDNAQIGYDADYKNIIYVRINKSNENAKYFSTGKYSLEEDSPIDPKILDQLPGFQNPNKKYVILKRGTYLVKEDGDSYLVAFNYYLK